MSIKKESANTLMWSCVSAAPGTVNITTFNATSNTSLMLEWEELSPDDHNGIIAGYRIRLDEGGLLTRRMVNVSSNVRSYNFTGMYVCYCVFSVITT